MLKSQHFYPYNLSGLASTGRPDWSTELEVGRPGRSTDVHRTCTPGLLEGRSTDLVDRRELLLSGKTRSTRPVDRQRTLFSVPGSGRPGRSTEAPTVRNLTIGSRLGRSTVSPVDRQPPWLKKCPNG